MAVNWPTIIVKYRRFVFLINLAGQICRIQRLQISHVSHLVMMVLYIVQFRPVHSLNKSVMVFMRATGTMPVFHSLDTGCKGEITLYNLFRDACPGLGLGVPRDMLQTVCLVDDGLQLVILWSFSPDICKSCIRPSHAWAYIFPSTLPTEIRSSLACQNWNIKSMVLRMGKLRSLRLLHSFETHAVSRMSLAYIHLVIYAVLFLPPLCR